jgi:hypothetical protein
MKQTSKLKLHNITKDGRRFLLYGSLKDLLDLTLWKKRNKLWLLQIETKYWNVTKTCNDYWNKWLQTCLRVKLGALVCNMIYSTITFIMSWPHSPFQDIHCIGNIFYFLLPLFVSFQPYMILSPSYDRWPIICSTENFKPTFSYALQGSHRIITIRGFVPIINLSCTYCKNMRAHNAFRSLTQFNNYPVITFMSPIFGYCWGVWGCELCGLSA